MSFSKPYIECDLLARQAPNDMVLEPFLEATNLVFFFNETENEKMGISLVRVPLTELMPSLMLTLKA